MVPGSAGMRCTIFNLEISDSPAKIQANAKLKLSNPCHKILHLQQQERENMIEVVAPSENNSSIATPIPFAIEMAGTKHKVTNEYGWVTSSPVKKNRSAVCTRPISQSRRAREGDENASQQTKTTALADAATSDRDEEDLPSFHYELPKTLANAMPRIYEASLAPLDLRFGLVREVEERMSLRKASKRVVRQAVVNATKARATVCFVVKRPGCVLCFEQGHAISQLLADFPDNQVAAFATIKEIDVDNEGLLHLYQNFFRFPFFRDTKLALYAALGDRRVGIVPNPFKILMRYREIRKRLKNMGIEGNIIGKGEGMVLGGIIIFDRKGEIRYAHQEQFSRELPIDEIRIALRQVVDEWNQKSRRTSTMSSRS